MKHLMVCILCMMLLIPNACADTRAHWGTYAWETGEPPYDPDMLNTTGIVCWTSKVTEARTFVSTYILHSIDLATGKVSSFPIERAYLVASDSSYEGVLIARETGRVTSVHQFQLNGSEKLLFSYELDQPDPEYHDRKDVVVAYQNGYLYYRRYVDGKIHLRRDGTNGDVYDYQAPNSWYDPFNSKGILASVIQNADDAEILILEYPYMGIRELLDVNQQGLWSLDIECWLDDSRFLFWANTEKGGWRADQMLFLMDIENQQWSMYTDSSGEPILRSEWSYGEYPNSNTENTQVLFFHGLEEDFFCVPIILDLTTGKSIVLYETKHTDKYDEYCASDRAFWYSTKD